MSGNSRSSCLHTAPIVSDFCPVRSGRRAPASCASAVPGASVSSRVSISAIALGQVGQLVLADLQLVAVGQLVGLDPAPVDVGAVQRAEVVDVEAVAAPDEQRVIPR